jgi:hypothetical protein
MIYHETHEENTTTKKQGKGPTWSREAAYENENDTLQYYQVKGIREAGTEDGRMRCGLPWRVSNDAYASG